MIIKLDDLVSEQEMCEILHMRIDNLRRMRQTDPHKYELLVRGSYVKDVSFDILAKAIDVVDRLDKAVAIDKLVRQQ